MRSVLFLELDAFCWHADNLHKNKNTFLDEPMCFSDFFSSSLFPPKGGSKARESSRGGNLIFFFEETFYILWWLFWRLLGWISLSIMMCFFDKIFLEPLGLIISLLSFIMLSSILMFFSDRIFLMDLILKEDSSYFLGVLVNVTFLYS